MSFTHLHVATTFTPGLGTATPAELAEAAARDGATALACTDRDGLYGAVEHVVACRSQGLDPVLGVDLAVLEPDGEGGRGRVSGRVVVLARGGSSGYVALCRLVTDAHAHSAGRSGSTVVVGVTRQELAARSVDPVTGSPVLTVLVGPESDVGLAMHGPRYLRPRTLFKEWLAAMPTGTLAAEVVSHHEPQGRTFTTAHAARMLKLAREHHVPAILSNAVRHLTDPPYPAEGPRAAIAVAGPRSLSAGNSLRDSRSPSRRDHPQAAGAQAYLKDVRGMEQTAREIGHAADLRVKDLTRLLQDTEQLAESCRLDPARDLGWGSWSLPEPAVLDLTQSPDAELADRCREALERSVEAGREAIMPELRARLAHELAVVESRGAAPFLLAAAEVTQTISGLGIRVQGRGVANASLAAHLLGITPVNPLNHGTAYDGFFAASAAADGTEQLPVFPGIELDLESGRLREVHRALARRFGKGRVCLLGSVPAADAPFEARVLPHTPVLAEAAVLPEAPALPDAPVLPNEVVEPLLGTSDPSGTLPGGLSRQSSGLLFGDASLLHRVPTQPGGSGLPLSQYAPDDLVHWGALRVTLRESATQTVIARTLRKLGLQEPPLRKPQSEEPSTGLTALDMEPAEATAPVTATESETPAFTDPAEAMAAHHMAWLRSRHPAAFIAACWDCPAESAPRHLLRAEARRLGIPVLPLDVNQSSEECAVEADRATADGVAPGTGGRSGGSGLRPGLRDVSGVSTAERKRLVAGRPYRSVEELFTRAALSRATVRKLAEAGALESLCSSEGGQNGQDARAAMVRNLQELGARPVGTSRAGVRGQLALPLGDRLEVHDDEGLVTGSPVEGGAEAEPHDDASADPDAADPEAADSEAGSETPSRAPAGLAAVIHAPQLSRARTPGLSESPPPTSHTPVPVRRTGSG
ncbi:PHP domain-containing protein [Arthrobacter sp. RCC_34]|uniref:helix-hairpin-helix domain-containing protein n=1 Tax=Arthrobacter sp. RCC_34 TaxID=3239230 RepID=UPI00352432E0